VATLTAALLVLSVAALAAGRLHVLLQMLQQEHYENARLHVWVQRERRRLRPQVVDAAFVAAIVVGVLSAVGELAGLMFAMLLCGVAALYAALTWGREQVKPLVFTTRAKRLFALGLALCVLPVAAWAAYIGPLPAGLASTGIVGGAALALAPWLLTAANALLVPVQRLENERYVRAARAKLEDVAPLVVGISGSFGKTTTKACVAAALDPNGPTYPTPASFNSFLGVVRAINEGLERRHETFVVELGSYRIGDITEICDLVKPSIGILTSLGPAHLERFGSMDAIEQAEGELADALPADGLFVTDAADERCLRVARERTACPVLLFSTAPHPEADLWAEEIAVGSGGTEFRLCWRDGTEPVRVASRLLGEPNVANLLAAAAVAHHLGVTGPQIARALKRVAPPAHRLQPIVNAQAGIVVIDDSYNSNPIGAAAALDVLRAHDAKRRILVTPGMVELGEDEARENRAFGVAAASVCDICILSGPLAPHIRAGLLDAGYDEGQIVMTPDGPTAHAAVAKLGQSGDVMLFENDLPDVYA
jgi:UDP-N-acetylmuramoyl-tripeptide--D-alanyl-D-alanine ligase